MSNGVTRIYSDCKPRIPAGREVSIQVSQNLLDSASKPLLGVTDPQAVKLTTHGPQTRLTPADIAGVYPVDGSDDSPDEFLPHIALTRRTLPWERTGPGGQPWLALLLLKQSEMLGPAGGLGASIAPATVGSISVRDPVAYARLRDDSKLPDSTAVDVAYIPHATLQRILPTATEVGLLTHVKQVTSGPSSTETSIVICNRLPDAGDGVQPAEMHTALLVSLEHRDDLFNGSRFTPQALVFSAALLVLHQWKFKPSTGGDFEQVMQAIGIRPNGGVLRFGNLPRPATPGETPLSGGFGAVLDPDGYLRDPLPRMQTTEAEYRSPLRPFAPPPRSRGIAVRAMPEEFESAPAGSPLDYSHAAAFELGRLLALGNVELVEDLHEVRRTYPELDIVEVNTLPTVLQKPQWVVNPEEPFWSIGPVSLVKEDVTLELQAGIADFTGIRDRAPAWESNVIAQLGPAVAPGAPAVTPIDIGSVTEEALEALVPVLMNLKV